MIGQKEERHLVGLGGENLVAAELCLRGCLATTFAVNIPGYDVVVVTKKRNMKHVQVKTRRTFQMFVTDPREWLNIELRGEQQIPDYNNRFKNRGRSDLLWVFVYVGNPTAKRRFFILTEAELRQKLWDCYVGWLESKQYRKPRKHDSWHASLNIGHLLEHEEKWEKITEVPEQARALGEVQSKNHSRDLTAILRY